LEFAELLDFCFLFCLGDALLGGLCFFLGGLVLLKLRD
jgi:hypothetical protein